MKSRTLGVLLLTFLSSGAFYAQNNNSKQTRRTQQRKISKKISAVDQKVSATNTEIDSTIAGVDNAINGTKNTVKKLGALKESIFGPNNGKEKSKTGVVIEIIGMDFDDQRLVALLDHMSGTKGVKKLTKEFGAEQITLTVSSKKVASELWDTFPKNLQGKFKIVAMKNDFIMLKGKSDTTSKVTE